MGHSRAYPVFRTTDGDAAYARARELCGLLAEVEEPIMVEALIGTPERVRRVAEVVPGAWFEDAEGETYDPWAEPAGAVRFPVWVCQEEAPREAELPFLRAVGDERASLCWRGTWPVPWAHPQYDGVQVTFHSDDVELDRAAGTHTVFLHVDKRCPAGQVREFLAPAGYEPLGEARIGW
ncbi:hypothetical protein ACFY7C_34265 [Streptomyces sp. NPDC012769]|uniref:hypothetical protein n=1 Tax=Streptomyces sp. NPDC012769 TaxID=3364848 RepID=UPI00369B5B8F